MNETICTLISNTTNKACCQWVPAVGFVFFIRSSIKKSSFEYGYVVGIPRGARRLMKYVVQLINCLLMCICCNSCLCICLQI